MESNNFDRRSFCVKGMQLIIGAGVASYLMNCSTKETLGSDRQTITVDVNQPENLALKTVGGAVYVTNPKDTQREIIVYRKSNTEISAFSSRCTHQGVKVELVKDGIALCPAHDAEFDVDGKVLKGPADKNLPSFQATIQGSIISIIV